MDSCSDGWSVLLSQPPPPTNVCKSAGENQSFTLRFPLWPDGAGFPARPPAHCHAISAYLIFACTWGIIHDHPFQFPKTQDISFLWNKTPTPHNSSTPKSLFRHESPHRGALQLEAEPWVACAPLWGRRGRGRWRGRDVQGWSPVGRWWGWWFKEWFGCDIDGCRCSFGCFDTDLMTY